MKICKDCKYCRGYDHDLFICEKPKGINLIDWKPIKLRNTCEYERKFFWIDAVLYGRCGKSGRYFENKAEGDIDVQN